MRSERMPQNTLLRSIGYIGHQRTRRADDIGSFDAEDSPTFSQACHWISRARAFERLEMLKNMMETNLVNGLRPENQAG